MSVVHATSVALKKLLSTKSGAAFIANYHAKIPNGTLIKLLHPFKYEAKKKVCFVFVLLPVLLLLLFVLFSGLLFQTGTIGDCLGWIL